LNEAVIGEHFQVVPLLGKALSQSIKKVKMKSC